MRKSSHQGLRKPLADVIRAARKSRKLSQEDFALISSRTYLSSLERGLKSPTIDKLDELAIVLGMTPAALLLAAELMANDSDVDDIVATAISDAKRLVGKM